MDSNQNQFFENLYKITEENNILLKKMHKNQQIQSWLRVGYWVIILGVSYGGYLAIKPMLGGVFDTYKEVNSLNGALNGNISNGALNELLKVYNQ